MEPFEDYQPHFPPFEFFDLNCLPIEESLVNLNEASMEEAHQVPFIDLNEVAIEDEPNGLANFVGQSNRTNPGILFSRQSASTTVIQVSEEEIMEEVHEQCLEEEVMEEAHEQCLEEEAMEEVHHQNEVLDSEGGVQTRKKHVWISNEKRRLIYNALLQKSVNGKLRRGTTKEVASLFSVPLRTVQRIWNRAKLTPSGLVVDVSDGRSTNIRNKRVTINLDRIAEIPLPQRTTLRSLAKALTDLEGRNISHQTLHRRKKEGLLRRHSNALKPHLREEHKLARLQFCISMLDTSVSEVPRFSSMHNIMHIDEKWFYLTKKSTSYYLLPTEDDPLRSCQSKNFIVKVMFLAAVARPRFDEEGNVVFSGKIGVFPFVTKEPAMRHSRNRPAGTLVTKPVTSVKKETVRAFLIEKIIPSIQSKWPTEDLGKTIFIQQDNARTHVRPDDEEFMIAASGSGFDIRLICQPANSPDMNVLDLGFFNAIQSLKDKECVHTVDDLIQAVERAYESYPTKQLNRVFLTLQQCMKQTMTIGGSNNYKIPHIHKAGLERRGMLPTVIDCPYDLVESVKTVLGERNEWQNIQRL